MARRISRNALLLCLACWTVSVQAGDAHVVRTEEQLKTVLASGKPTPLDAFTPYGRRTLLRSIRWTEDGRFAGLNFGIVERELDAPQIAALLTFFDSKVLLPILTRDLSGRAIRLPEPSSDIDEKLQRFYRLSQDDAEQRRPEAAGTTPTGSAELLAHYTRLFGDRIDPASLRRQPLGDLLPLFDAANIMNFYHPGSALQDQINVHRELVSRGVSTQRWIDTRMFEALMASRRFEEARVFASARPALAGRTIPVVADPLGTAFKGRSLYRYDSASNTLTREAAPAPSGIQVVMVVQEGCQFSAMALEALREDGELQSRLRQSNLLLLTHPSSSIPLNYIAAWNAANPAIPMRATYNIEEWKGFIPTGVPEFFVLKNGVPVGRLTGGWPAEGNKAALMALLDAARD